MLLYYLAYLLLYPSPNYHIFALLIQMGVLLYFCHGYYYRLFYSYLLLFLCFFYNQHFSKYPRLYNYKLFGYTLYLYLLALTLLILHQGNIYLLIYSVYKIIILGLILYIIISCQSYSLMIAL